MEINPFDPPQAPVADVIANTPDMLEHLGISRSELIAFAGDEKYPDRWLKRLENKTYFAGFNVWAFLFGIQWFFYRKLYFQGAFSSVLEFGAPFLVAFVMSSFLGGERQTTVIATLISAVVVRIIIGYWANLALYNEAVRTIHRVDNLNLDNDTHLRQIKNEGSVSVMSVFVVYLVLGLLRFAYAHV